jgi:hypothetical protein
MGEGVLNDALLKVNDDDDDNNNDDNDDDDDNDSDDDDDDDVYLDKFHTRGVK